MLAHALLIVAFASLQDRPGRAPSGRGTAHSAATGSGPAPSKVSVRGLERLRNLEALFCALPCELRAEAPMAVVAPRSFVTRSLPRLGHNLEVARAGGKTQAVLL